MGIMDCINRIKREMELEAVKRELMQQLLELGFRYKTPSMLRGDSIAVSFYDNGGIVVFDTHAGLIEKGKMSDLKIGPFELELNGKKFPFWIAKSDD